MQSPCDWIGSCIQLIAHAADTGLELMAFRLRPDESVTHGLRRLARKELERARGELRKTSPPRDEAIHEARKSVKKARAIRQLIDDDDGHSLGGSGSHLHSVNRTLSGLRDAEVMIETFAQLRTRHPRLFSEHTFARVRHDLATRKRDAIKTAGRNGDWTSVDRKLQTARRSAKRWQPAHKGSGALTRGIRAAHRRGRKAMTRAREQQQAPDFHAWRKEIKALWYALRLVEHSDPRLQRDIRALHRAEILLGDDHNLVVLCEQLSRDSSVCRGPVDIDRLRLMADRDQCRLRKQAVERVRQIYERRSGAYARAVVRGWKASRLKAKNGQQRRKHGPAA